MSADLLKGKQNEVYRILLEEGPMLNRQIAEILLRRRGQRASRFRHAEMKRCSNALARLKSRNAVANYGGGWFALPADGITAPKNPGPAPRPKKPPAEAKPARDRLAALESDHEHRLWLDDVRRRREQKERQWQWQARC